MRKATYVMSAALAMGSLAGVAAALLVPVTAMAEQQVGPAVGKHLKAAQDAIKKKNWSAALAAIKQAQDVSTKTAYEQYKVNELLWYVQLQQGRNLDAARLLEQQMGSGQMPANEKVQRTKTLAQLYFRGATAMARPSSSQTSISSRCPATRTCSCCVAQAYYQQKDYKNAIAAAETMTAGGKRPSEDILQLMLRSSYEIDDAAGTEKALDLLLKYYPSKDTWQRVLDGYISKTKHDDELLALYRLAEDVGALTKARQYTDMSQALVVAGFAMEGERVIQQGLAGGVFQGEELGRAQRTLQAATRRANVERQQLPKAEAMLAAAKTGMQIFDVGKLYFSAGDYAKAAPVLAQALAKGGLEDTDRVEMLYGISLSRQGKTAEANKAFAEVKDAKFAEVAKLWIIKGR